MSRCNTVEWEKETSSTLNFTFDWTKWLAGDTITSAIVTYTGSDISLVIEDTSFNLKKVTVLLSGGTATEIYSIKCTITTAKGLLEDEDKNLTII